MAFVVDVHDEAHGGKTRPFGRIARWQWRNVATKWPAQGALRWSDVRDIARELGADPSRPRDDAALRLELARRIGEAAAGRRKFTPAEMKLARMRAIVREMLRAAERENREPE
jgi:hypothetical protein